MNNGHRRLLLIEDNPGDARLMREMLVDVQDTSFALEWVDRLSQGLVRLVEIRPDVVLLDLSLPDSQGLETFRQVQARAPGVPIVVMTGLNDEDVALSAMREGAEDYLVKGQVDGQLLIRSLRYAIERKRTQNALRASEERFRLLAEHAQDLIYRYRLVPTPGFDYVSPAVTAMTGYTPMEFYADPNLPWKIVHPEDHHLLLGSLQPEMSVTGRTHSLRWLRKDGTIVWTEERVMPIFDGAGSIIAFEGIARDVTQRKRVEEERERLMGQLAAERSWLHTVIERAPVGMFLIEDAQGERVVANRRAEEFFGRPITPEGGIVQYQTYITHADGRFFTTDESCSSRALKGELITAEERLVWQPDGQAVPVLVSAGPIKDEQGSILGAVVIFEDITTLKELERLREEWTSLVAHDLRQPVAVIDGYASLLAKQTEQLPGTVDPQIAHIRRSAKRLQRMISDLLDASRIEASRLTLMRKDCDLVALINQASERMMAVSADHTIRVEFADERLSVEADPVRLEQVMENLLSNAVKYGDANTEIQVTVGRRDEEIQVSVTNRGIGIAPENLPNLFKRFGRVRVVQEKRIEGIGLGLYITKGLVEAHGGRIWVDSIPDVTTTFHFTLPVTWR